MLSERLKKARILSGLSQDQVIHELAKCEYSLTKGGLSKYERGGSTPKSKLLQKLSKIYDLKVTYFFDSDDPRIEWVGFRKHSTLGKGYQDRIRLTAEKSALLFSDFYKDLNIVPPKVKPHKWKVNSYEDVENTAKQFRVELGVGDSRIDSLTTAIEDYNGIVIQYGDKTDKVDGLSGWTSNNYPVVVVNKYRPTDRKRLNLAHELGHLYLSIPDNISEKDKERFCHRFAASLLVPASVAYKELGEKRRRLSLTELVLLKSKYGLSVQAWIIRAFDLGIITNSQYKSLFVKLSKSGWRKNEPGEFIGSEEPVRMRNLILRALSEGIITEERAEELLPGILKRIKNDLITEPSPVFTAKYLLTLPKEARAKVLKELIDVVGSAYKEEKEVNELKHFADEFDSE